MPEATSGKLIPRKRLVLCFDGTGNTFSGTTGDTNIVKLYDKFDRDCDDQFHYYQTGIGTYDIGGGSLNKGFFGRIKSNFTRTIDEGFGTSFDAHVMAGYRFAMQYYDSGDKIYMFGFSRGAYTARFLCRMINTVGLLSKGNEEMIPFAYQLYQDYEQGKFAQDNVEDETEAVDDDVASENTLISNGTSQKTMAAENFLPTDDQQTRRNKLNAFTSTFCRREKLQPRPGDTEPRYAGVKVYFLGLFDCVNSVAVLESKAPTPMHVLGSAVHTRHAVAVDERRVKFKVSLLAQEKAVGATSVKEVWFPGNHGDVGGGWVALSAKERMQRPTFWDNIKKLFRSSKAKDPPSSRKADPYQMSDIPLSWMMSELDDVDKEEGSNAIRWNSIRRRAFDENFTANKHQALTAPRHDTMRFFGGSGIFNVLLWNFMEYLPIPRFELVRDKWVSKIWPPNAGNTRDIPKDAVLHDSVIARLETGEPDMTLRGRLKHVEGHGFAQEVYRPMNQHGDDGSGTPRCLAGKTRKDFVVLDDGVGSVGGHHRTYGFRR